jgi:hypothetical protein
LESPLRASRLNQVKVLDRPTAANSRRAGLTRETSRLTDYYFSKSYHWRSPAAMASARIPASSALFAEMTATSQPVSGLGRTWTSCPSSARPSLIISANSSAATFVLCFMHGSVPFFPHFVRPARGFANPLYYLPIRGAFVATPALFFPRTVLFESVARQSHQANKQQNDVEVIKRAVEAALKSSA